MASSPVPAEPSAAPSESPEEERVPLSTILAYSLPMAAMSLVFTPFGLYYMKFGIETLLIAPAAIGGIQLVARLWDAVSDPLVGAWSDRTRTRWGRSGAWLVASAIPVAITYTLVWAPPAALEGGLLVAWLLAVYLLYETASTGVFVPYSALGLELSEGHHDRTRVFAWRAIITAAGTGGGFASLYWLREAADPRSAALGVAAVTSTVLAASIIIAAIRVPERKSYRTRRTASVYRAFRDIWSNPHARIYLGVVSIESFGMAIVPQMVVFILDDVVQDQYLLYWILFIYAIPQFGLIPLWVHLSKRVGKKRLWLFGMAMTTLGFTGAMFLGAGTYGIIAFSIACCGIGLGISGILAPSVAADVVDYDELLTGERKEGSYTAILNLLRKTGLAAAAGLAGIGLQIAGYDPAAEVQAPDVQRMILWLGGGIPALTYLVGLLLFTRFRLDETEHARVQSIAHARREDRGDP
jgi:GPH family glycoside/pentoside/hexuronide:cation symporter